jgi:hypothetical protein
MKVTGSSVSFGSSADACKFTDVHVANEASTAFSVTWQCRYGGAEATFSLRKIWGKEVLVTASVNTSSDASVSIYQRSSR